MNNIKASGEIKIIKDNEKNIIKFYSYDEYIERIVEKILNGELIVSDNHYLNESLYEVDEIGEFLEKWYEEDKSLIYTCLGRCEEGWEGEYIARNISSNCNYDDEDDFSWLFEVQEIEPNTTSPILDYGLIGSLEEVFGKKEVISRIFTNKTLVKEIFNYLYWTYDFETVFDECAITTEIDGVEIIGIYESKEW